MFTKSLWDGVEGIVLDAVGTLIEPWPSVATVYRSAASRQGVDLEVVKVRERFSRGFRADEVDESLGAMVTNEALEHRRWRRIVGAVLPEVPDPDRAFRDLWDHFGRPESWRSFDDVGPALREFRRAGLKVGIASNFDGRLRGVVRGLTGLSERVDVIVISSEVGVRKPHPRFYESVCESLNLAPGRVLFAGDDPENDVEGPLRAGLRAVLIDRHGTVGSDGSFPDLTALANGGRADR